MRTRMLLVALAMTGGNLCAAQPELTAADLLQRVIDLDRLCTPPPAGERVGLHSSAAHGPAAGTRYLRSTEDGWHVLTEVAGPGALTRLWCRNPHGDVRIVLDGETVVATKLDALLAGQVPPIEPPLVWDGKECVYPLGFARQAQVLCRADDLDCEVSWVQFAPGTTVRPFSLTLDEAARVALTDVQAKLKRGLPDPQVVGGRRTMPVVVEQELQAGDVLRETLEGAGTVRALYVALTDRTNPRDLYALHRCVLRLYFDGQETPAVEAPLVDFFGSGFDLVVFNSLPIGTDRRLDLPLPDRPWPHDRFMYCLFPMPYRRGVRIEIENFNASRKPIGLLLYLRVDTRPPAADAQRFYARFRRAEPGGAEFVALETAGPGRLVGTVVSLDSPQARAAPLGELRAWLDDLELPALAGGLGTVLRAGDGATTTGMLAGATRPGAYGKVSGYRWQIGDALGFQKGVRVALGLADAPRETYCSSVVYWYGSPVESTPFTPLMAEDLAVPGLRIPGAIEVERCIVSSDWGNPVRDRYYDGVEFSGEVAANITTSGVVRMQLPWHRDETVRLKLRANPARRFETITVLDGAGNVLSTISYDPRAAGLYLVGDVPLKAGNNVLGVQCSRPAILDCWILSPAETERGEELGE